MFKIISSAQLLALPLLLPILTGYALAQVNSDQSETNSLDWSRFRGPNGQGVVDDSAIPTQWDANSITWKTSLPGEGHSSPVIWQNQVYVTSCTKTPLQGTVVALDATTGKILWQKHSPLTRSKLNGLNSYASSTPAVSSDSLYVFWPSADELVLTAFDHDGQTKWSHNYGRVNSRHGLCVSPIVYKDLLIFSQEQYEKDTDLESRWLGVDRHSGEIRWELKRNNRSPSYITPCLYTDASGQEQLIFTSQAHGVTGIDPTTGKVLWELSDVFGDRTIGSPLITNHCIIAAAGSSAGGKTLIFVQPGSATTQPKLLHSVGNKLIPYIPTMIVVKGRLYTFHDAGTLSCWDIASATPIWSEKLKGKFYGSPIAIGDHIYCVSTRGDVVVVKAGDTYQPLTINPLGEKCQATPAVTNGRLFFRTFSTLTCVGGSLKISSKTHVSIDNIL